MAKLVENFNFLKKQGFKVTEFGFAETVSDAIDIGNKIGYPLVLKIPSEIHKTDVGGIATNIHNVSDLKTISKNMVSNLAKQSIDFEGLVVQKQIKGIELIVGLKKDPVFGKVILLGSGGILAELLKDVTFRVCPILKKDAKEMINEIKSKKILDGFRGEKIDTTELEKFLIQISKLEDINELDLNPIFVNKEGCWIVDARIIKE